MDNETFLIDLKMKRILTYLYLLISFFDKNKIFFLKQFHCFKIKQK